jgi:hypothetical protein
MAVNIVKSAIKFCFLAFRRLLTTVVGMWFKSALTVAFALAAAAAIAQPPVDIFVLDRTIGTRPTVKRLTANLLLGKPDAARQLERALARGSGPSEDRIDAYLQLCGFYFREQLYADGLRVCTAAEAIKAGAAGNMIDLQRAFQQAGPSRWSSAAVRIPLQNGQAVLVNHGGTRFAAQFDTGAEIGVISNRIAKLLDARPLGTSLAIGTTTTPVDGGLVQIDRVTLGNATLSNLTAFVLPDEQAKYAELELVIPLSAMLSLGRMAYVDHGSTLLLGRAAPNLGRARTPLYWDESGVGFAVRFGSGTRGVHFDTGSKRTWLFPTALAALSPAERATRRPYKRTIGGLGGERVEDASLLRGVTLRVAGQPWRFDDIEIAEKDENGEAARIGTGLLKRFRTVVLDARRMQMSVADR